MTSATTGYDDERFRNVEFGVQEKLAKRLCEISQLGHLVRHEIYLSVAVIMSLLSPNL